MTSRVSITVNDKTVVHYVPPRMHLGDFLREQEGLTGTHLGCEHGVCGACVVLLDGEPIRSCITYAVACTNRSITTIEGYGSDPIMSKLRKAFSEHHALQCGYCTPGMLATARDIVLRLPDATERIIRAELSGNLCRCTGYLGIVNAILAVLSELKKSPDSSVETLRQQRSIYHSTFVSQRPSVPATFETFNVSNDEHSEPIKTVQTKIDLSSIQSRNGTTLSEEFDLPFSSDVVWAFMIDLPSVAQCLPGAHISSIEAEHVSGGLSLKFGPMKASFDGAATISIDHINRKAIMNGAGQDRLSQSRATGNITYQIEALGSNQTRVHVSMLYSLQGPLAQFSRSGIVKDFVRRLIKVFADNISAALSNPHIEVGHKNQTIRPISLFFSILLERIRRIFGRS